MTTYDWDTDELKALAGKTILITGAATGIGRAALEIAHSLSPFVEVAELTR